MTIPAGTRLGPYEIVSVLGAGAMGEVYRARDSRLGREAAIKVLPPAFSSDPESLRRFEKEARAASALNHPNIVTVFDVGLSGSIWYIAMELVDGKSLREMLAGGPLPLRKTIEIAAQIAEGLAAAHDRGLVHRDLKPQNVMVTREGLVKVLDFGLAKRVSPASLESEEGAPAKERSLTTPGTILGTVGYMSPEQARGEPADFRSDQFSLGVILYEMASGKRAFDRGSAIETLSAILRDEPSPLAADAKLPPPFCWVVERCLVKEPEGRYGSTRDLASDLKGLWGHISPSSASLSAVAPVLPRRSFARRAAIPLAVLAGLALVALAAKSWRRPAAPPSFEQLTFRRGTIWSARFAPDGKTVVYAAAWDGRPFRLFRKGPESADEQPLAFPAANLLAVSQSGEVAAAARYRLVPPGMTRGMLVRAPMAGGAPREVEGDVLFADWSPDGQTLAVVRAVAGKSVLEYPVGKRLYETDGFVSWPRVSPDGNLVAFLDHPTRGDDRGTVAVVDRSGQRHVLTPEWAASDGLAWHPGRNEIWFGATGDRQARAIHAVDLSGRSRIVARAPGNLVVQDISAAGSVLATRDTQRIGIVARPRGEPAERDFSWLDASLLTDLSSDGRSLLFTQFGRAVDATYFVFLRRVEEESPIRLGDGFSQALSPDGTAVLSIVPAMPPQLHLLPTGAGPHRRIVPQGLEVVQRASWFPDGKRILVAGSEPGRGLRLHVCDLETGRTRALTPAGILLDDYPGFPVSPDGARVAAVLPDGRLAVFPTDGGEGRPIPALPSGMAPVGWTADGRRLFVYRLDEAPARVFRVDPVTGEKELWRELGLSDPAGIHGFPSLRIAADGSAYAYSYARFLSELYVVEGLE